MKITIFGGGFGLYGYLPALYQVGDISVLLPIRYQAYLLSRPDLQQFNKQIEWVENHEAAITQCDGVIIALPPEEQFRLIKKIINRNNITYLFLEKPLAHSPQASDELLNLLKRSGKTFRIGYNFRYTCWGKALLQKEYCIDHILWHFRAHHYANDIRNWKRDHQAGGGALRFYGIHIIALLAEAGYANVQFSSLPHGKDECQDWQAELSGNELPNCKIQVATNSEPVSFIVKHKNQILYSDAQPFQTQKIVPKPLDQRIPFLIAGLSDLFFDPNPYYNWYETVNSLWQKTEACLP